MQPTSQEIEAQDMLSAQERKSKAEAILSGPASPGAIVIGLITGAVAGLSSYLLEGLSLPSPLSGLLVGIACAISVISVEQWSLRRRLEAAIEIVKLLKQSNER